MTGSDLHLKRIVLAAVLRSDWVESGKLHKGPTVIPVRNESGLDTWQWRRPREATEFGTHLERRMPDTRGRYL